MIVKQLIVKEDQGTPKKTWNTKAYILNCRLVKSFQSVQTLILEVLKEPYKYIHTTSILKIDG